MEDPRYDIDGDQATLTASSDDELKDLEKEYEAKVRALMQKKKQKKEQESRARIAQVLRSRSPSPERVSTGKRFKEDDGNNRSIYSNEIVEPQLLQPLQLSTSKPVLVSSSFTNQFIMALKQAPKNNTTNYIEKYFEFENIPAVNETNCDEKDKYSHSYFKKRYYTVEQLDQLFENKKILLIDQLFAKIYPPAYNEPNYPNWILVGMILSKSDTKHANDKNKSKYMKLQIGNFMHSVDLMLFGDAYKKYWKLRVGDVIAVLNPKVSPFRMSLTSSNVANQIQNSKYPRGFNLKLDDNSQCIIEMGKARDLGYCKSIKKNGHRCNTPINIKKGEYCNYHLELAMRKASSQRMALNGSVSLKAQSYKDGTSSAMYLSGNKSIKDSKITTDYTNFKPVQSAAEKLYYSGSSFFNDEYTNPKVLENIAEKRRKIKEESKDYKLAKKLSNLQSKAKLSKIGLMENSDIGNNSKTEENSRRLFKAAFNNKAISQIGFNPTNESDHHTGVTKHKLILNLSCEMLTETNVVSKIDEFKQLSNDKTNNLDESKEAKRDKLLKWKQNIENLRIYKQKSKLNERKYEYDDVINYTNTNNDNSNNDDDNSNKSTHVNDYNMNICQKFSPLQNNHESRSVSKLKENVEPYCDLDSDSDIEIKFSNDLDEKSYKTKISNK